MITVKAVLEREAFVDAAVLRHGFTDYMRDYELVIGGRDRPSQQDRHTYHFVGCVEASYHTALAPMTVAQSLTDALVDIDAAGHTEATPAGFVWGVRYATAYPGLTYVEHGERAVYWTALLGRPMHEVTLETQVFHLRLVFADVRYARTDPVTTAPMPKDHMLPVTDSTADGGVI